MKKIFVILLFLSACIFADAQSTMTDSQIISFVQKEQSAGTSQQQIVIKLIEKGVTVDRIRQLRKQYESMQGGNTSTSRTQQKGTDRTRKQNGESERKDNVGINSQYRLVAGEDIAEMNAMNRELSDFRLDSLDIEGLEDEELDGKKRVFGRDIFNKKNLSFEPNMNIATPDDYILGPGDAVYIDIYGATQKSIEATVSPEGVLNIEGFGPVQVSGLTVAKANDRLRSTLGGRYSSSKVKLTVGQTRTISVNVMGEVKVPGTYTLSAFASVFHALYMAGGTSEIGTLRAINVYRRGKLVSTVDVYDYILNGKLSGNVKLADGDVIVVGTYDCLVSIEGKVKRPMFYEMKKTESMSSLLKYAGGFTGDAYTNSVRVVRKTGRDYSVYNVSEFDMSSFLLSDEDVVSVDSILPRFSNMVEVKGAVFRPGMYQLGGNITTVRSLIEHSEGLTEDAFAVHAVLHRMKNDRSLEVLSVDVAGILNGTLPDVPLRNEDVLFIPSTKEVQESKTISIHGEVVYPGIYKYAENESVEDFILQAGGLKETASEVNITVSRRIVDPRATSAGEEQSQVFNMSLRDGFIIGGENGFVLQPYDEVYVRKSPGYNVQQNVEVDGEVLFRGTYALKNKNTRLSDVIKAAGGLNNQAFAEGARLERHVTEDERQRMEQLVQMQLDQQMAANSDIKLDSVAMAKKLNISETMPVGIDLKAAMAHPGSDDDIVLRDGDRIIIPQYNGTVRVSGEVMYANTVAFENGKSTKYYIRQAGGYGLQAKKSHAYIIYANGKVGKVNEGAKVQPGCEIVVPMKPKKRDGMQTAQQLVSIASVMATMSAVIVSVVKK